MNQWRLSPLDSAGEVAPGATEWVPPGFPENARRLMGRIPLASQIKAAGIVGSGKGLIVRLPTGAGKTVLGSLPFALGLLPQRQMVFTTPLRSLTSAQAHVLRTAFDAERATVELGAPWQVREQTGAVAEDPLFTGSVVVSTFDQALSSALRIAYSTSPGQRTINAGAVLTAYWVADEIHLYPREKALTTLLWLLRNRPRELPFLLMTATLSDALAGEMAELLGAAFMSSLPIADREKLGLADQRRRVRWQPTPIDPVQIRDAFRHGRARVLVVVNTVRRAIELADDARMLLQGSGVTIRVLHSLFYADDRRRIESAIRRVFGKDPPGPDGPTLLIGTQVIEAGLDISGELVLTELAPANALVQRWGRCARWGGTGEVVVAPPPESERGVWPYEREAGMAEVIRRTRGWLEEYALTADLLLDEAEERALVETAHEPADRAWLSQLRRDLTARGKRIGEVASAGEFRAAGELIRHVDSRSVLVHGDPERIARPTHMEGFSLAVGTILRLLTCEEASGAPDEEFFGIAVDVGVPWRLKVPIWPSAEVSARQAETVVGWETATRETATRAALLVLHPSLATYDPDVGLRLLHGEGTARRDWSKALERAATWSQPRTPYHRETAAQHLGRMMQVLTERPELWPRVVAVASALEDWADWPSGLLDQVVRGAIVLHDSGKLTTAWAAHIGAHQSAHGMPVERWLVHSDDPPDGVLRHRWHPPPHALAGAAHSLRLGRELDEVVEAWRREQNRLDLSKEVRPSRVLFHAIATHHSPELRTVAISDEERLADDALAEVGRLLIADALPRAVARPPVGRSLSNMMVDERNMHMDTNARESLLLAVVVRLLRLADQWSQASAATGQAAREEEAGC